MSALPVFRLHHFATGLALAACLLSAAGAAEPKVAKTERGATVETDRFRVTVSNGVVTSVVNKLTNEEYLDLQAKIENILPHLPSGLGTQAGDDAISAAAKLYHWPWWELPAAATWPNQHYPTGDSKFEFAATGTTGCTLAYTGLTDGKATFADEKFTLALDVDPATGDLLLTPAAASPRPGVYAANLSVSALAPAITAEAPIFDGVRLDREMRHTLWVNAWGGYWDYSFIALNGYKTGAVGIWTQDPELKCYKMLFYLINGEGLSFSFSTMNIPPFEKLTEAKPLAWRLQAFDKSWSQAAARFRDWRLKNQKFAARPEWTKQISYVNGGVNAGKMWVDILSDYFGGQNLDRTVTFAATIRRQAFDRNHADNAYYDKFPEEMKAWKTSGAKLMAYLQPMIMWSPNAEGQRQKDGVEFHNLADTRSVFVKDDKPQPYIDQHHLGEPHWQRWFLDWVKEYINPGGADGVYHDQSYHCPIDRRGLAVNGMTSTQGMADYFYKAQTENPNAIHGTEHMTEVNNVGASLGIGSGILWGTAPSMRHQRIGHASPVSNALHYPNGTLWTFPHYSDFPMRGDATFFHWGMDLAEKRGEIAAGFLQNGTLFSGKALPFDQWRNELWLERERNLLFIRNGLRPVFPEDWDRHVLSYFKGAKGEDFRYVQMPWGTAFIQMTNGAEAMQYGRLHGVTDAAADGAIAGWVCYNESGPAGLHPDLYYCLNPKLARPAVCFSTNSEFASSFYESYVQDGFANGKFAFLRIRPIEAIGSITGYDSVVLHAPAAPVKVLVNGQPSVPTARKSVTAPWKGQDEWVIQFMGAADIVVFLAEPPAGFGALKDAAAMRITATKVNDDIVDSAWLSSRLGVSKSKDGKDLLDSSGVTPQFLPRRDVQTLLALRPPTDAKAGVLKVTVRGAGDSGPQRVEVNGQDYRVPGADPAEKGAFPLSLPLKAGDALLLNLVSERGCSCTFEWLENPAATPPAK